MRNGPERRPHRESRQAQGDAPGAWFQHKPQQDVCWGSARDYRSGCKACVDIEVARSVSNVLVVAMAHRFVIHALPSFKKQNTLRATPLTPLNGAEASAEHVPTLQRGGGPSVLSALDNRVIAAQSPDSSDT